MTDIPLSNKRIRFNKRQMEIIVETMEANPNMNKPNFCAAQRSRDWIALSQKLNKNGGAVKSAQKWQKCWSDYKNEIRKRFRGMYYATRSYLTPLEERVGKILGIEPTFKLPVYKDQNSIDFEISNVGTIPDIPVPTIEPEKSTDGIINSESSTPLTHKPITIKLEPEDVPKKPPKANEPVPSNTAPVVSAPRDIIPLVSKPSDTISVLAGPIDIVPFMSGNIDIIPIVGGPIDLVPLLTGSGDNITLVPKDSIVTGLPSVSNINKANNDIIIFEKSSVKSLQNTTVKHVRTAFKSTQTTAEDVNQNTVTEALRTLSRALRTLAENQRAQIVNEERRTILLEKLIHHFCS